MNIKGTLLAAAIGLFAGTYSQAMAATVFTDGDFSDPAVGAYASFGAGQASSSFGPWNVTSGNVDLIGSYWSSATLGGGSVDLDGFEPGTIQQSFSTNAGSYVLKFFLSGNPDGGPSTKNLNVSIGNASQDYSFTTGANYHSGMAYTPETLTFQSTGSNLLTFASLDGLSSSAGAVISGISISPVSVSTVPLPAALPLFGAALLGLAGFAKRRNNLKSKV